MALIQCRECKGTVSDAARVCPHCGVDTPNLNTYNGAVNQTERIVSKAINVYFVIAVFGTVIGAIVMILLYLFGPLSPFNSRPYYP